MDKRYILKNYWDDWNDLKGSLQDLNNHFNTEFSNVDDLIKHINKDGSYFIIEED